MTKKTKQQPVQFTMPDLPWTEPEPEAPAAPDPNTQISALQGQIAALQAQLNAQSASTAAVLSQPVVTVEPKFDTDFKTDGLPDPTLDPERYAAEVNSRVARVMDQRQAQRDYAASQQSAADAKYNALWEAFGREHPDYAKDGEKVEFVATKAVKKAVALGLDANRYMASQSFFKDVVSGMDAAFGKPGAKPADDDDDEDDNVTDGRTNGMFGGVVQGNAPIVSKDDQAGDMAAEIRAFQEKTGFHR